MSRYPHGGPYQLAELRERYPDLNDLDIALRIECIRSPLFLGAEVICGSREVNLLKRPSAGHREVEKAMVAYENILYVDHRGTLKTTVLDEIGSVWDLLDDPETRILFLQSNIENAKMMSRQVRGHFVRNKTLRRLFPEYALESGDDGNVMSWSVPCKRTITLEASFTIATPGVSTTGLHFDVIRASDLMNPETVPPPTGRATPEAMKSIIAWYATTDGLLVTKNINPRARKSIDSNMWHNADHVSQIVRADPLPPEEGGYFRKIIRGVKRGEDGKFIPTWPEGIPSEELHAIHSRPTMTPALWHANYESSPSIDGGMSFRQDRIHTYGKTDSPKFCQCGARHRLPDDLVVATTVDSALTDQSAMKAYKSDRSALVTTGVSASDKKLYVLNTVAGRWEPNALIEQIMLVVAMQRPLWVGIEDIAAGIAIVSMFQSHMQRTGRMVPYRKIRMPGVNKVSSKDLRIGALHGHVHSDFSWGGLYVNEDGSHAALVEELLNFGVAEHDDLADAIAMRGVDLWYGSPPVEKKDEPALKFAPPRKVETPNETIMRRMKLVREGQRPVWRIAHRRIG